MKYFKFKDECKMQYDDDDDDEGTTVEHMLQIFES